MHYRETRLETIDEVFETLRLSNINQFGDQPYSGWIFRGHRHPEWQLVPTTWRDGYLENCGPRTPLLQKEALRITADRHKLHLMIAAYAGSRKLAECAHRNILEDLTIKHFYQFADDLAILSKTNFNVALKSLSPDYFWQTINFPSYRVMPLAQHYGIPTRLLDWTRDPLTALSFALEGSGDPTSELTVWAINSGGIRTAAERRTHEQWALQLVEGDNLGNPYLRAQRGAFTTIWRGELYYLEHGRYPTVEDLLEPGHDARKFIIPTNLENDIFLQIRLMRERRTRAHLKPDLGTCAAVALQNTRLGVYPAE